jgi:hypothetical protein
VEGTDEIEGGGEADIRQARDCGCDGECAGTDPIRGLECKDLGDNIFLFTFHQAGGRKKAVEDGPWTFDKCLLVMEEFDATKNLDEYAFDKINIWVHIFKLPLGMMNRATGEDIGDQIGEFVGVDGVEDGLAMGCFLRVKVKMLITKPLTRGTMVEAGEDKMVSFSVRVLARILFCLRVDRSCGQRVLHQVEERGRPTVR